ncbi:hypothetical protein CS0771_49650 [Catellatospora sp. IY07-71]|uniref:hypothetical protein n=1 Tax=Catellatospora sp. IY07-71 TaxID=2728827 RepID=UPI001BB450BF|nr:hypothetical protein [Catellatospora sp. IY07-71]BCJ75421.1 hypothetical protein CS0771_49650 [Catellatospora sp. IY07-71]
MASETHPAREPVDAALRALLPPRAAEALWRFAVQSGTAFELARHYPNARSGAVVCAVREHRRHAGVRKIILKLDTVRDAARAHGEYVQQQSAVHEGGDFARRHLVQPAREPVWADGRLWFTFQELATGEATDMGLADLEVLTALLDAARTGSDEDALPTACAHIVRSVLGDWAAHRDTRTMDVPAFLRLHVRDRLDPGGDLHAMASARTAAALDLPDEPGPLANPLRLVTDSTMTAGRRVVAVVGKAHGDLHTENVLVPVRPVVAPDGFRLIDLMKYGSAAPLTRDPVHLVLYIVARSLAGLAPQAREALFGVVLDPATAPSGPVPGWLYRTVVGVHAAAEGCARSLIDEWREQAILSVLGNALIFVGRASTRDEDRDWFLRLAARAADAYLGRAAPAPPVSPAPEVTAVPARASSVVAPAPDRLAGAPAAEPAATAGEVPPVPVAAGPRRSIPDWRSRLCRNLAALRTAAQDPASTARIDALAEAASAGHAGADAAWSGELDRLMLELLHEEPGARSVLPGAPGGAPLLHERYACPGERCRRIEQRRPGGPLPTCAVTGQAMRLRAT